MTARFAAAYAALAAVVLATGLVVFLMLYPGPLALACPTPGTHLIPGDPTSPLVVTEEEFANGTYPIGRPFVVLACELR